MNTPFEKQMNRVLDPFERDHDRLRTELMARIDQILLLPVQEPARSMDRHWQKGSKPMKPVFIMAAALIFAVGVTSLVSWLAPHPSRSGMALAEVLAKFPEVRSLHVSLNRQGKPAEAWVRRPNQLRIEYADGTYELSDGPKFWIVEPAAGRATQKDSIYYREAQQRGIDVLELINALPSDDDFSGFLSEKPAERARRDGKVFDVYRSDIQSHDAQFHCEALVDVGTGFLHSIKLDRQQQGQWQTLFEVKVLAYNVDIPDEKFAFNPLAGMKVVVETPLEPPAEHIGVQGSTLTGRITWAGSDKPVGGARVWCSGGERIVMPDGTGRDSFSVRAETDRNGMWKVEGAPTGGIQVTIRSWELNWPAIPVFQSNVGTYERPVIVVDGRSAYNGLDFQVRKPQDVFAQLSANVTDENGKPVKGAGAYLERADEGHLNIAGVYAARGQQFTGPDGKIDASDLWPTPWPVRLVVMAPDETRFVNGIIRTTSSTKPFVVESEKSYHFDLVLPSVRR